MFLERDVMRTNVEVLMRYWVQKMGISVDRLLKRTETHLEIVLLQHLRILYVNSPEKN